MNKDTEYQSNFSKNFNYVYDTEKRLKKAVTILKVLQDYCGPDLSNAEILSIGASTGVIEDFLADNCKSIAGIDVDNNAIFFARQNFTKQNLTFQVEDGLNTNYPKDKFDIILCNHIYEHVPDAQRLMSEIHRLLKPNGACYFTAENRIILREPHHNLLFLSVMPKFLAHYYMRLTKKGEYYHETHFTYWGLKKLVQAFTVVDYTKKIVESPGDFAVDYMLKPNSRKYVVANFITKHIYWLCPTYIWILEKNNQEEEPKKTVIF